MPEATVAAPKLGSSMVGTSTLRDYSSATRLVLVAGHAVYAGTERRHTVMDDRWIGGFRGEARYYTEHVTAGIETAREGQRFVLVFSGGPTRAAAGPIAESASYYRVAEQLEWLGSDAVKNSANIEPFAKDSWENLAFGVARFAQLTGRKPEEVIICNWAFKEDRYRMHADSLGLNQESLHYVGVNNPEGSRDDPKSPMGGALIGEKKALADFQNIPFGDEGILLQKRLQRDPFNLMREADVHNYYRLQSVFPLLRKSTWMS